MKFLFLLLRISLLSFPVTSGKYHNGNPGSLHEKYQRFAMEPQDQTAIIGSRVTLPCRVIDKTGLIQWTKDDFGLGVHRNLSGFERYSMVGSDEEGDFSLDISPVMLDDDARYQCQVSPGANGMLKIFYIESKIPFILTNSHFHRRSSNSFTLCKSHSPCSTRRSEDCQGKYKYRSHGDNRG